MICENDGSLTSVAEIPFDVEHYLGVVTLKRKKNVSGAGSIPDPIAILKQTTSEDMLSISDDETYTTGRLFLITPDDHPQTLSSNLSNCLMVCFSCS